MRHSTRLWVGMQGLGCSGEGGTHHCTTRINPNNGLEFGFSFGVDLPLHHTHPERLCCRAAFLLHRLLVLCIYLHAQYAHIYIYTYIFMYTHMHRATFFLHRLLVLYLYIYMHNLHIYIDIYLCIHISIVRPSFCIAC